MGSRLRKMRKGRRRERWLRWDRKRYDIVWKKGTYIFIKKLEIKTSCPLNSTFITLHYTTRTILVTRGQAMVI